MRRRNPGREKDLGEPKAREQRRPGITEMEMDGVSGHLDDPPPVPNSDLADELRQCRRDMSSRLIARFVGQSGVARQIGEGRGLYLPSWFGTHARLLECRLDVL